MDILEKRIRRLLESLPGELPDSELVSATGRPFTPHDCPPELWQRIDLNLNYGAVGELGLYFNIPLGEVLAQVAADVRVAFVDVAEANFLERIANSLRNQTAFGVDGQSESWGNMMRLRVALKGLYSRYARRVQIGGSSLKGHGVGYDISYATNREDFESDRTFSDNKFGSENRIIIRSGEEVPRLLYRVNPTLKLDFGFVYAPDSFGHRGDAWQRAKEQEQLRELFSTWKSRYHFPAKEK